MSTSAQNTAEDVAASYIYFPAGINVAEGVESLALRRFKLTSHTFYEMDTQIPIEQAQVPVHDPQFAGTFYPVLFKRQHRNRS